ncbi:hypothetical protein NBZ79_18330 [Sneathiella marina]|uniref:Uncharacterized protein n=1 Tax=Sneathiella marina TaxID=2950108 RepID=A0ABY4W2E4_9PROT|nr:hypothetical protein [Sneathiella marina]USG61117.1 hypothetical protein NBZ79_18330 [Sneathiella marina]
MKLQKYWYLGFLGLIGLYKLPVLWAAFTGAGHWGDFLNILWLYWFFCFVPERKPEGQEQDKFDTPEVSHDN